MTGNLLLDIKGKLKNTPSATEADRQGCTVHVYCKIGVFWGKSVTEFVSKTFKFDSAR